MRWWVRARCLLFGLCLVPAWASAREPVLPGLSWVRLDGAEACISTIALAQRVEDKLGRSVFVPTSAAELTIEGFVMARPEGGFLSRLSVVTMDGRVLGTRELQTGGTECAELDEALVLVIAVTLNPDTGIAGVSMLSPQAQAALDEWLNGAVPEADPATTTPTVAVRPPSRVRQLDTERPPTPSVETRRDNATTVLDVAVLGGGGMLPSPAFGAEVGAHFALAGFPLAVGLQGFLPRTVTGTEFAQDETAPPEVLFVLARASLAVCPAQYGGTLSVEACIGIDAGAFYARGSNYVFDSDTLRPIVDLLMQVNLRWWVGEAVALRFGLAAGVPVTPITIDTRLVGRQRVEMFAMSPITVVMQLGLTFGL